MHKALIPFVLIVALIVVIIDWKGDKANNGPMRRGRSLKEKSPKMPISMRCVGIIDGRPPIAILEEVNRESHLLRSGDRIGDLEISEIRRSSVILKRDNEKIELFIWEKPIDNNKP